MPSLRLKEIRAMSSEERLKNLNEFQTEILRLKTMIKAGGTVENPAKIRELRKSIARILTIEKEQSTKEKKLKRK